MIISLGLVFITYGLCKGVYSNINKLTKYGMSGWSVPVSTYDKGTFSSKYS